jgi:hypothetical protein
MPSRLQDLAAQPMLFVMALEKTNGYQDGVGFAAEVVAGLQNAGINLAKEIPLSFYLYVPNRKAAGTCEPILVKEGLEVVIEKSAANDGKWLCLCHGTLIPTAQNLERIGQTFVNLARKHGGEFDGWETNPYKIAGGVEGLLEEMMKKLAAN